MRARPAPERAKANRPWREKGKARASRRNRAVVDAYEPGSTLKVVTMAETGGLSGPSGAAREALLDSGDSVMIPPASNPSSLGRGGAPGTR